MTVARMTTECRGSPCGLSLSIGRNISMSISNPSNPCGGYPKDAVLAIYEDNNEETFNDPEQGGICIYDIRQQEYWSIQGSQDDGDCCTWGLLASTAFYRAIAYTLYRTLDDELKLGASMKGHPLDAPDKDISELSILGWVTTTTEKLRRGEKIPRPMFHISMPTSGDATGRRFLAGVISYATVEDKYTPWHICYNWEEDEGFHRADCAER